MRARPERSVAADGVQCLRSPNIFGFLRKVPGLVSDLNAAEVRRVLPIATAYGLVLGSMYLLKPARNAMFLSHVGVDQLPYVLLLVAAVGAATTAAYGRLARQLRTDQLLRVTFLALMVMLAGFRFLLPTGWPWVYYVFFVWVALYGVLTTSLIWLMANSVFTAREARRVFGFIGTGGIVGAISGGLFTGWVVDHLGTVNLLVACIGALGASLALLGSTPAAGAAAEVPSRRSPVTEPRAGLRDVFGNELTRILVLMTGLVAAVAVIVDIQFNQMVDRAFVDEDAKTAFFGQFFAYLSVFSLLVQVLVVPVLFRTVGAGLAGTILPAAMGLGSAAMVFFPGLLSAALAKGADGGFRHSVHKAASEVLFLPVPPATKKTAKLFLDTTVDTAASGLAAALVVVLSGTLGLDASAVAAFVVVLTLSTLALAPRLRVAYVDAFRNALERRTIDPSALTTTLSEAAGLNAVLRALEGDRPRQIVYALDLLTTAKSPTIVPAVLPLLDHPSDQVRCRALRVLRGQGTEVSSDLLTPMLDDESPDVRQEAMLLLSTGKGVDPEAYLRNQLDIGTVWRKAAALGCIARYHTDLAEALLTESRVRGLVSYLDPETLDLRIALAGALPVHPDPELAGRLTTAVRTEHPAVQRAAIEGMGRRRDPRYVPFLVEKLTDHRLRGDARRSLARYGDRIVAWILFTLDRPGPSLFHRQAMVRVLEDVGTQAAVDTMLALQSTAEPPLQRTLLRSLSRLRNLKPDLIFTHPAIDRTLMRSVERAYDFARVTLVLEDALTPGGRLLARAVREKRDRVLEVIFWVLSLRYPAPDILAAQRGVRSPVRSVRASALEFLENILPARLKLPIVPLLDPPPRGLAPIAAERFPKSLNDRVDVLRYLLTGDDPWLKACAVYCVTPDDPAPLPSLVRQASLDADPIVRQTAETAMCRRSGADGHR